MTAFANMIEPAAPLSSRPFLAFAATEDTARTIETVAAENALAAENVIVAPLDRAITELADIRTPDLLIVDLGDTDDILSAAGRLAQVCDADARVILIGKVNDLRVYRKLLNDGVADYLVTPLNADDLAAALARSNVALGVDAPDIATAPQQARGDIVGVIGVRGGVGASTVAANAAWWMSTRESRNVNLIDMDLTFGTQALLLDIDPGGGLVDAMTDPGRMDELFVKRAAVAVGERLRVMAAETDLARGNIASAAAFQGLLAYVRDEIDTVVVDLPRSLPVGEPEMLAPFDRVVLVAEPTLAAMRDAARLVKLIGTREAAVGVDIVLNRQGVSARDELSRKTFEEGAGLEVSATIPFDAKTAFAAEAAAHCILQSAPRSKIGRAMEGVARVVAGVETQPRTSGLVGWLRAGVRRAPRKKEP